MMQTGLKRLLGRKIGAAKNVAGVREFSAFAKYSTNAALQQQEEESSSVSSTEMGRGLQVNRSNSKRKLVRTGSMAVVTPSDVIIKKRNGEQLTREEIHWFIQGFHNGTVADYQMSAFLMAVCVRGMSNREASDMTMAMVATGETADLSKIKPNHPKVDKHSTGGVGDTLSLILAPLVACFDIVVPMMSGRSLGHSGGSLDKMEAIPGLRTNLSTEEYLRQLEDIGVSIVAPTPDLAPVDRTIYALRDVSGSVENVALVASSIMSKKLAERPDALLLDVKLGRGAFFKGLNDAASLAKTMVAIGENAGIDTCALITNMNQPLGGAIGNFLEIREAIQVLSGEKYPINDNELLSSQVALKEIRDLALSEAAIMLGLGGKCSSFSQGYNMAKDMLDSGAALDKFAQLVEKQGGDTSFLYDLSKAPVSNHRKSYIAEEDVIITEIDAFDAGMASTRLGAGRVYANQPIDYHAGIVLHAKVGEVVKRGNPIFTAIVGDKTTSTSNSDGLSDPETRLNDGFERALQAFTVLPNTPENYVRSSPIIEYFVDRHGLTPFNKTNH